MSDLVGRKLHLAFSPQCDKIKFITEFAAIARYEVFGVFSFIKSHYQSQ